MNPQQDDEALQNVSNPLKVMQPGERVICELKRHPIGLLGAYISFGLVVVVAVVALVAAPRFISGLTSQAQAAMALGAVLLCGLVGLFTYISVVVYKGNRWVVTSDSITQIDQISLFRKQTSQLSLANLEDVTVEQNGILQSMFGYGRLRAESAGQRGKFVFDFCPDPSEYAKRIIAAHEAYIAEKPDEMHTTNQALANTTTFNQSYGQPYNPVQQASQPPMQPQQAPYNPAQPPANAAQPYDPTQPYARPAPQAGSDPNAQWQNPANGQR